MALETILASAVRALKVFEKLDLTRRIDRVRVDSALQSLRQIFFYSSELIAALEDIEAGREVEDEVVRYFADVFRNVTPHIQEALEFIEIERFEGNNLLLIEEVDLMRQIRFEKIDTRREISRFFQSYQGERARGSNRLATEAARVLGQIERFNVLIKKLEAKLLAAHQSGRTASPRLPRPSRARKPAKEQ